MITVVTWNVNSINARLERVLNFLDREQPDYLCLQELKCSDDNYPNAAITAKGYQSVFIGQKAYNGVAVLSKRPLKLMCRNFMDDHSDNSSRFMVVETEHFKIMNAYVPNGQSIDSEKYPYKLDWLSRARKFLDKNAKPHERIVLLGDFNIAPDDRDVYDPIAWKNSIHCTPLERQALKNIVDFGFIDTMRIFDQSGGIYSWWNYREGAFLQNRGLRIDIIYATLSLAMHCKSVRIDLEERTGEKPSDHAPVIASFAL